MLFGLGYMIAPGFFITDPFAGRMDNQNMNNVQEKQKKKITG